MYRTEIVYYFITSKTVDISIDHQVSLSVCATIKTDKEG